VTVRYLRQRPNRRENLEATLISGALAAGIGLVTFYFVRLILARETIERDAGEELGEAIPRET
jgi:hypothetical protein